jgi:hypothetical protein
MDRRKTFQTLFDTMFPIHPGTKCIATVHVKGTFIRRPIENGGWETIIHYEYQHMFADNLGEALRELQEQFDDGTSLESNAWENFSTHLDDCVTEHCSKFYVEDDDYDKFIDQQLNADR